MVTKDVKYIAEIGINHNGSVELAKEHIDAAVDSGADVVKFQTYITDTRVKRDAPAYSILKECELPFEAFAELKSHCDKKNAIFASTAFCPESVTLLEQIDCKIIKVASFFLGHKILLERIFQSKTTETAIVSTGVSSQGDIIKLHNLYESMSGNHKPALVLMHCISQYPISEISNCNMVNISELSKYPSIEIGYSDHTIGTLAPVIAVSLGARWIEKHFTIDNKLIGADHSMSADPEIFRSMVTECDLAFKSLGSIRGNDVFDSEREILGYCVKS